ncbi:hypothetical protein L596_016664 [Steinernema carpocapsae]|uniref:Uncharacterized protein n=1 Tax=Steinernema carpocapsae TaxID=34508 RepID=A0A4U5NIL4_STECR|nr:hypothetical protein L596_016664 [Steinernema carpocapsae]
MLFTFDLSLRDARFVRHPTSATPQALLLATKRQWIEAGSLREGSFGFKLVHVNRLFIHNFIAFCRTIHS